jgi:hypothetical protein
LQGPAKLHGFRWCHLERVRVYPGVRIVDNQPRSSIASGDNAQGESRRCGMVIASASGRTVQKPCFAKSTISSQTNSTWSWADLCEPRVAAANNCCRVQGGVVIGTPAPRLRRWWSKRRARCGMPLMEEARCGFPRFRLYKCAPTCCETELMHLLPTYPVFVQPPMPAMLLGGAADISPGASPYHLPAPHAAATSCHGGARSSQGAGACAASAPWRPHQAVLWLATAGRPPQVEPAGAREHGSGVGCAPALTKSRWVARRPQLLKQPPFPHQDTQNSVPASLRGGFARRSSRIAAAGSGWQTQGLTLGWPQRSALPHPPVPPPVPLLPLEGATVRPDTVVFADPVALQCRP